MAGSKITAGTLENLRLRRYLLCMLPSLIPLPHRSFLAISGPDCRDFLQGLITNDVRQLTPERALYACLLTPQGKILADFFLYEQGERILLEASEAKAGEIQKQLTLYKLRSKVTIAPAPDLRAYASLEADAPPADAALLALADPRHAEMGRRIVSEAPLTAEDSSVAYEKHRLKLGIPDSGDFIEGRSFPMEFGIAYLQGISYSKGCYVGQEIVARNKTRGTLHKALHRVTALEGAPLPSPGTPVLCGDGREAGILRSAEGMQGLALLRLEYAAQLLSCGGVAVQVALPKWFQLAIGESIG